MSEPFTLRNDGPKYRPWKAENALPARQGKLFVGTQDLPGQGSLFNADGPREPEHTCAGMFDMSCEACHLLRLETQSELPRDSQYGEPDDRDHCGGL